MPVVLDARSFKGLVVNLDTGQLIRFVCKVQLPDDPCQPGEYEAQRMGPDGKPLRENGKVVTYRGKCRMRLIPNTAKMPAKPAARPGRPTPQGRGTRIRVPLLNRRCQHKGCCRLADWRVSDEMEVEPLLAPDQWGTMRRWSRARTVGYRWYCDWHYQPARVLDHKGEVVQSFDNVKARPD